jgi:hypothetical protein
MHKILSLQKQQDAGSMEVRRREPAERRERRQGARRDDIRLAGRFPAMRLDPLRGNDCIDARLPNRRAQEGYLFQVRFDQREP